MVKKPVDHNEPQELETNGRGYYEAIDVYDKIEELKKELQKKCNFAKNTEALINNTIDDVMGLVYDNEKKS